MPAYFEKTLHPFYPTAIYSRDLFQLKFALAHPLYIIVISPEGPALIGVRTIISNKAVSVGFAKFIDSVSENIQLQCINS